MASPSAPRARAAHRRPNRPRPLSLSLATAAGLYAAPGPPGATPCSLPLGPRSNDPVPAPGRPFRRARTLRAIRPYREPLAAERPFYRAQASEASTPASSPCAGSAASMAMSSPPRSPIISSRITATGIASSSASSSRSVGIAMRASGLRTRRATSPRSRRDIGDDGWPIAIRGIRLIGGSRPVTETGGAQGPVPLLPPPRRTLHRRIS
jgi:hypothetical protein